MLSNKDLWFEEYERLQAEREVTGLDISDEELAEIAMDRARDRAADIVDRVYDEERDKKL